MSPGKRALAAAALGWHVIPCGADKRPLTKHGLKDATTDLAQIRTWWEKHPDALPAVVAGPSGLAIADFDVKGGKDGHAALLRIGHPLPTTWGQDTPSGGSHSFYLAPVGVELPNGAADLFEKGSGIDRRTGESYAILYSAPPVSLDKLAPAPEWLVASADGVKGTDRAPSADVAEFRARLVGGKPRKRTRHEARRVEFPEGAAHEPMLETIATLVRRGVEGEPGIGRLLDETRERYVEGSADRPRDWDLALAGSVRRFGLPPVTFKLTKADKRRVSDRHAAIPLSDGASILDETRAQIGRFVAFPGIDYEVAVTLWAAHTHLIDRFDSTPRLAFLSAEPGSGKTRALEVLAKLVHDPVETMNTTTAFLARRIDSSKPAPAVLFDEVDTLFGTRTRDAQAEELRGILNSGHRRGAKYSRAAQRGQEVKLEEFSAFAPVAMAGLGELPDTIRTRAVIVPMRRRSRDEPVEPYRERQNGRELEAVRDRLAAWAHTAKKRIGDPWPEMPEGITDRPADVWEALIAVADAAGGEWPAFAREAAIAIVSRAADRPASLGIRLLADVRRVIADRPRIRSTELLHELTGLDDAPWSDLGGKGAIDARYLGRTFDGYGIPPAHALRFDPTVGVAKGWNQKDFADAWARYLPDAPATFPTTETKEQGQ